MVVQARWDCWMMLSSLRVARVCLTDLRRVLFASRPALASVDIIRYGVLEVVKGVLYITVNNCNGIFDLIREAETAGEHKVVS